MHAIFSDTDETSCTRQESSSIQDKIIIRLVCDDDGAQAYLVTQVQTCDGRRDEMYSVCPPDDTTDGRHTAHLHAVAISVCTSTQGGNRRVCREISMHVSTE